jgi:hypothetical protein
MSERKCKPDALTNRFRTAISEAENCFVVAQAMAKNNFADSVRPDCAPKQPASGDAGGKRCELCGTAWRCAIKDHHPKGCASFRPRQPEAAVLVKWLREIFGSEPVHSKVLEACNIIERQAEQLVQKETALVDCRVMKESVENLLKEAEDQLAAAQAENDRLRGICLRESGVLYEALKRKNNKSMIKVVADSLADQKGGGDRIPDALAGTKLTPKPIKD